MSYASGLSAAHFAECRDRISDFKALGAVMPRAPSAADARRATERAAEFRYFCFDCAPF